MQIGDRWIERSDTSGASWEPPAAAGKRHALDGESHKKCGNLEEIAALLLLELLEKL